MTIRRSGSVGSGPSPEKTNIENSSEALSNRRLNSVQALRAVAALIVVIMHATGIWEADPLIHIPVVENARSLGVYLFFAISGFIVATRMPLERSLPRYLLRRYLRVFPLAALATGIAILISLWHGGRLFTIPVGWDGSYEPGPLYIVKSILMVPMNEWPYLAITWSLPFEIVFYALFGTLALLLGQRWASLIFIGWAVWRWASVGFSVDYGGPWYFPAGYYLFFAFGILAREWLLLKPNALLPGLFAVSGAALIVAETEFGLYIGNLYLFFTGAAFMGLIVFVVSLESKGYAFTRQTVLTWLGDISFPLYLVHLLVINTVALAFRGSGVSPLQADGLRLLTVVLSIAAAAITYRCFEKPVNARIRRLISQVGRSAET